MKNRAKAATLLTFVVGLLWCGLCAALAGEPIATKAKQAFMIEAETGTILLNKKADEPVQSASLMKLMTAEYVFHLLKTNELTLDREFPVSEYAWRTGGALSRTSTMFAALKSRIRVEDLLKGMIVQQANDACIILAEGISGSDAAFTEKLNARAKDIGLKKSNFANSSGLPDERNRMTMRDLVILSRDLHGNYPDYFPYFAIRDFEWNKIKQRNRFPLFASVEGSDGFATGYSEEDGYGIVATVERNGVRLYLAMSGLSSPKEREDEARNVLEWGLSAFEKRQIFAAGEVIGDVPVYGGADSHVAVAAKTPVSIFQDKRLPDRLTARIAYDWPFRAPVEKGAKVGALRLYNGEEVLQEVPVYAQNDVRGGSLTARALDAVWELLFFWL
ncbi:D-alanyl-D-alanine carboxypeptidase family protein [Rhizobium sp. C1]|uniref:D-alanyl-D-alanine carboxypeptidase family protein n=1 Tax=Rhizobium sp. C1 TaxID=1349799 RepID=UPI001E378603|nr:D-alanyl-D-alanine carboxypeptidase family protein [Rhizobium sp. C1]MCD2177066.1 D-alanyl-D-alanine carboxypeptidase [Rhizobium sp. C1]